MSNNNSAHTAVADNTATCMQTTFDRKPYQVPCMMLLSDATIEGGTASKVNENTGAGGLWASGS